MLNFSGGNLHTEGQIATNTPQGVQSLPSSPLTPSSPLPLGVKITSHTTGQQVPTGQLTISGTSTDTPNANCEVYSDVNDLKPMQKVAARGPGGNNDYSAWTFTYTSAYSLIKNGTNNLTSKISCIDSPTTGNLTKWNSVNLTGVDGLVQPQPPPSITSAMGNSTNNTGLLISQSAALSAFEPTVAPTATTASEGDDDNSDNSDNSEETNEENDDDDDQDNEEADGETDDEEDSEEETNDVDLFSSENVGDETDDESENIANDETDVSNDENNNDNSNPSNSDDGKNNENNVNENNVNENSVNENRVNENRVNENRVNENRVNENSVNENSVNENSAVSNDGGSAEVTAESETNENSDDDDDCDIGEEGFPFCDGWLGEVVSGGENSDDDDDCDIGEEGFPFCDGRID
jgi:hypothetical protein